MRNKSVYSCSINIHAPWFDELLESIFCLLMVVEPFSLQKVDKMLEEVVVGWQEVVRWIQQIRQNFVAQSVQLLKRWLYDTQLGAVVENWARSVDQCWLQTLQFSVHLIDLLSILLIIMVIILLSNGFIGTEKAAVDQTGSRPPDTDCDLFFVQVWL